MLNILFFLFLIYGVFTLLCCFANFLMKSLFHSDKLSYYKAIQISNVGFGASLMVTFLSMLFIPQFDVTPEEKTLYLLLILAVGYLLIVIYSFYSHLTFVPKEISEEQDDDEEKDSRQF